MYRHSKFLIFLSDVNGERFSKDNGQHMKSGNSIGKLSQEKISDSNESSTDYIC